MHEFCPLCTKKGLKRKLKAMQINLREAAWMCETEECLWPIGYKETIFVSRMVGKEPSSYWDYGKPAIPKLTMVLPVSLELSMYTPPVTPCDMPETAPKEDTSQDALLIGQISNFRNINHSITENSSTKIRNEDVEEDFNKLVHRSTLEEPFVDERSKRFCIQNNTEHDTEHKTVLNDHTHIAHKGNVSSISEFPSYDVNLLYEGNQLSDGIKEDVTDISECSKRITTSTQNVTNQNSIPITSAWQSEPDAETLMQSKCQKNIKCDKNLMNNHFNVEENNSSENISQVSNYYRVKLDHVISNLKSDQMTAVGVKELKKVDSNLQNDVHVVSVIEEQDKINVTKLNDLPPVRYETPVNVISQVRACNVSSIMNAQGNLSVNGVNTFKQMSSIKGNACLKKHHISQNKRYAKFSFNAVKNKLKLSTCNDSNQEKSLTLTTSDEDVNCLDKSVPLMSINPDERSADLNSNVNFSTNNKTYTNNNNMTTDTTDVTRKMTIDALLDDFLDSYNVSETINDDWLRSLL